MAPPPPVVEIEASALLLRILVYTILTTTKAAIYASRKLRSSSTSWVGLLVIVTSSESHLDKRYRLRTALRYGAVVILSLVALIGKQEVLTAHKDGSCAHAINPCNMCSEGGETRQQ
jgi:RNA polymerase subunit RPABC4/transcription elongation factor Spt4